MVCDIISTCRNWLVGLISLQEMRSIMGFPVGSNIDLVSLLKDVPQNYEHIDPTNCKLSSTILLSVTIYARDTALLHLYFEQYYLKMRIRIAINIDMLL